MESKIIYLIQTEYRGVKDWNPVAKSEYDEFKKWSPHMVRTVSEDEWEASKDLAVEKYPMKWKSAQEYIEDKFGKEDNYWQKVRVWYLELGGDFKLTVKQ